MTEELITALGKVEGLRVAARTSAFAFKGTDADVREIGAKLNVGTVLEGACRAGPAAPPLGAAGEHQGRVPHLVGRVRPGASRRVRGAGRPGAGDRGRASWVTLQRPAGAALVKAGTADLEAHDLYLQGRFQWNQRTYQSLPQAVRYFERAIARDSGYAEAWAALAEAYVLLPIYGASPTAFAHPRAGTAALRALALDSTRGPRMRHWA